LQFNQRRGFKNRFLKGTTAMIKKFKNTKKVKQLNEQMSKQELKDLLWDLTDEELIKVCDWLLNLQRTP
jgi:hypothetical protein